MTDALNMALLRGIAQDLCDFAGGELPVTPDALRHLAAMLDDICMGSASPDRPREADGCSVARRKG